MRYYTPFELAPAFRAFKRDLFPCRTRGGKGSYLRDAAGVLERMRVIESCRRANVPLFLVHGACDSIVAPGQARAIREAYSGTCRFVSPRLSTHMTTLFNSSVTGMMIEWLSENSLSRAPNAAAPKSPEKKSVQTDLPLFSAFPRLRQRLPFIGLGEYPTPVRRLDELARRFDANALFVKQDGLTGRPFGGNKVRKLEFLLGEARALGAREVMTFGCAGSNHAAATAVYAHRLGMRSISMLLPQPHAPYVETNLLVSAAHRADLRYFPGVKSAAGGAWLYACARKLSTGRFPFVIPAGGSSPRGIIGYCNAAFELLEQIRSGALPPPQVIYVPMGTMGTAIGLMLGLRAAGAACEVVPVRVTDTVFCNEDKALELSRRTVEFLRRADPSFPEISLSRAELNIRHDLFAPGYAEPRDEVARAIRLARETEGLDLEGTYSGRAFAALAADAAEGRLRGKTILFWDTHNAYPLDVSPEWRQHIPKPLLAYFAHSRPELKVRQSSAGKEAP
jgi:1-aminocyclopropane-1-carboxylate deaminase/D-cysteine desulfhydrase-like pyridoxal-dependent ACC family enzyme